MPLKTHSRPGATSGAHPIVAKFNESRAQLNESLYHAVRDNDVKKMAQLIKKGAVICPSYGYSISLTGKELFVKL